MRYPKVTSNDPLERELAYWVKHQRVYRRQNKLSPLQIRRLEALPQWDWGKRGVSPDPNQTKQQLLEMARNGEDRPVQKNHSLATKLCNYTNPNIRGYEPEFDKEIRALRPDWFYNPSQTKQQLLEMARNGEDRPVAGKHPLGYRLSSYITQGHNNYDAKFDKKIRKLRPDWFPYNPSQTKQQLLEMARNGEGRPIVRKHPLGSKLCCYTNSNNGSYDPKFDREIRELRPDWFVNTADIAKQQLLEMARSGKDRPAAGKHPLGHKLHKYTNPNKRDCYDQKFDKEIRTLRPDWFKR